MAFEVFDKRLTPLQKAPAVTIQKRGIIALNPAAYALIGSPKYVELLFDRAEKIVGIRPSTDDVPHAYAFRPQGGAAKGETAPVVVAGTAFVQYYDIDTSVTKRWAPTVKDGILCVDLKEAGTEIVGNRSSRKPHDALSEGKDT